ncbi:MAG: ribonuclease E inhibitor RraB [Steroidobacteraceae bacterium]
MWWFTILMVAAGMLVLLRIGTHVLRFKNKKVEDWDSQFISQLRKAGIAPFDQQVVDFFFAVPSAAASAALSQQLQAEGFETDSKPGEDGGGWSTHARKSMRLAVPEMQALTARLRALAEAQGGQYDGWAVAKGKSA